MADRCWNRWAGLVLMALALLAFGAGGAGAKEPGAKTAPSLNLDGVWSGFVVYGKGEDPKRGTVQLELTIEGNSISARRLDGEAGPLGQGVYRITAGPRLLMDGIETRDHAKGRIYQGICKLEDDVLKWCVATPGIRRPKTFESKGQQFFLILKRQK